MAILAFMFGVGARHSVVVEAETRSVEIEFSGQSDYWDLGEVTACVPLDKIKRSASPGDGLCDLRRYSESYGEVSIDWDQTSKATIVSGGGRTWSIIVEHQSGFKERTRLIVTQQNLDAIGALSFTGNIRIGNVASSGENNLLMSGSYEFRERSILSGNTETIKLGQFRRGEHVEIDHGTKSITYGFLQPSIDRSETVFVSAISDLGKPTIVVSYFGGRVPIYISPNWIDRAVTSPVLLAISLLFPIGLSFLRMFRWGDLYPALGSSGRILARLRKIFFAGFYRR